MIWKKSSFSYVLWLLYAMTTGICLVGALSAVCGQYGWPAWAGYAAGGFLFLAGGVTAWLLSRSSHKNSQKRGTEPSASRGLSLRVAEGAFIVLLLALGLVIRVMWLPSAAVESPYFEYAKVAEGQGIPQLVHGATYLYLKLLNFLFFLAGNKIAAGYWLQVILQLLAFLVFYFAVRRLSGVIPAAVMLLFGAFSPCILAEAVTLSPRMMYFLLYGIALWMAASLPGGRKKNPAWCAVCGMCAGLLIYMDIMGVTLLFFALGIFFTEQGENSGEGTVKKSRGSRGVNCFLYLAGALVGWLGVVASDAAFSGKAVEKVILALAGLYRPQEITELVSWSNAVGEHPEFVLLFAVMGFGILSFFSNRLSDPLGIWILVSLFTALAVRLKMFTGEMDGSLWVYVFFTVLAGVGISNFFRGRERYSPAAMDFDEDDGFEMLEWEEETENDMREENKNDKAAADNIVTVNVEGKTREIRLLDNPLPLPKKKAHKAMDYDYEVADNDDYDI